MPDELRAFLERSLQREREQWQRLWACLWLAMAVALGTVIGEYGLVSCPAFVLLEEEHALYTTCDTGAPAIAPSDD